MDRIAWIVNLSCNWSILTIYVDDRTGEILTLRGADEEIDPFKQKAVDTVNQLLSNRLKSMESLQSVRTFISNVRQRSP